MHPAAFHCVNNSESKLCRLDFLLPRGHRQTTIVKLSKRTFVWVLWSTINSEPQRKCWFDEWSVLDTTITWVETSRKQVTNVFSNWLKVLRCKLVFTTMVFDSQLQLCDRKRKQENLFCEGPLSYWRGIRVRKLFQ